MKTFLGIGTIALSCLLFSCKKDDSVSEQSGGLGNDYQPTTAGSEWNYKSTTIGNYKLKALGSDTLVDGKKFYKFDNSLYGRQYAGKENGVYSSYGISVQNGIKAIVVTLKDAPVGTTWTNTFNNQGTISQYTYKIVSRDGTKTVDGKTYNNVIAVEFEGTMPNPMGGGTIKFATGRTFSAKGIGGIASSTKTDLYGGYQMEDSTYLVSYTIK